MQGRCLGLSGRREEAGDVGKAWEGMYFEGKLVEGNALCVRHLGEGTGQVFCGQYYHLEFSSMLMRPGGGVREE